MTISGAAVSGINQAQTSFDSAARRISGTLEEKTGDSVGLSDAVVGLIQAKDNFAANIGVLKAGDELERSALSLLR